MNKQTYTDQQHKLAQLIRDANVVVALTGAGISVPSGIPDFRSAGGLWDTEDPMKVASKSGFINHPKRFWGFYERNWAKLMGFDPNPAHLALAELERQGLLHAIVTQNIDGLHQKAGSQNVYEVHGSVRHARCSVCRRIYEWGEQFDSLPIADDGHYECSCGNPVKPDLVLFEEELSQPDWDIARDLVRNKADLVIVVGTSLQVNPVASLPKRAAFHPGRHLAIINRDFTQWDFKADVVLGGDCADELSAVARLLV